MRLNRDGPVCLKLHALSRWVTRQLGGIDHERRVVSIASTLFDLTRVLHGLEGADLRLLRMAAMVHDVGRAISDDMHPEIGSRMVRENIDLPLVASERRALSYLTRHHKGRVPQINAQSILTGRNQAHRLRSLLALLRAADALDSRCTETPQLQFSLEGRKLRIHCHLEHNTPKARRVYTRKKKFRLLEQALGCRVEVMLTKSKSVRLVA